MILNCWEMDPENRPTFKVLVADLSQDLTCMADYLTLSQEDPVASERSSFTMESHLQNGGEYYLEDGYSNVDMSGEDNERNETYLNTSVRYVIDFVETNRDQKRDNDNSREAMSSAVSSYTDDDGYTLAQDLGPPVD